MKNYEKQLLEIIYQDKQMLSFLKAVEQLNLPDAWICAGLIRNKVWDILHNISTPYNDIDVIYFDTSDTSSDTEKQLEIELKAILPHQPWSVKNQARMHLKNGLAPFTSSYDGVVHFPETPTSLALQWKNGEIEIMAPYGLEDLFELKVEPTPLFRKGSEFHTIYLERIKKKKWEKTWNLLTIENSDKFI